MCTYEDLGYVGDMGMMGTGGLNQILVNYTGEPIFVAICAETIPNVSAGAEASAR